MNKEEITIASRFEEVREYELPIEVWQDHYLQKFANKMMNLSNRLNEIDDDDIFNDAVDIKEDYLPAIREFILNLTGL